MIILGLGSNMGDRKAHLRKALAELKQLAGEIRPSHIVESKAVLPPDAPEDWNRPYLNMVVCADTTLTPEALLVELKHIERRLGRIQRAPWAPREIDIDILAMDALVLTSHLLSIPHPQLLMRDFALLPLAELVPQWRYPGPGPYRHCTASEIVSRKGFAFGDSLQDKGMLGDDA